MTKLKRRDDELKFVIGVSAIFTLGLLFVDIFYSDWSFMFRGWTVFLGIAVILFHLAAGLAWYIVLANVEDYQFDKVRWWLITLLIGAIISVASGKAASNEAKAVLDDAKQEAQR